MFGQYLRFSLRSLARNSGFALAAILALGIGIGLNTAMFSVVDGILLKPLVFRAPDDLFALRESRNTAGNTSLYFLSAGNFLDYRRQLQSADLVSYTLSPFALVAPGGEAERYPGVQVSEGWFAFYGSRIIRGRDFLPAEHQPGQDDAVIISEGLWRDRFAASESLIGREVELNGRPRRVVGIVEARFDFPARNKIWAPLSFRPEESAQRAFHRLITQGRLRPGYSFAQARAELTTLLANQVAQFPAYNAGKSLYMVPLAEELTGKVKPALLALIGAVAFVLAIACANVANLILARGAVRSTELAVRASLGASRRDLIQQLLTESLVLALLGGLLGLLLAYGAFTAFRVYAPPSLPRLDDVQLDLRVIGYNLAAALFTGILFGLIPAIRLSRVNLHRTLKDRTRGGSVRSQFRSLLVVAQVAAAMMLMTGAGLLIRSLHQLTSVDLGFAPQRLLTLRITPNPTQFDDQPDKLIAYGRTLIDRLQPLPGVEGAALSTILPFQGMVRFNYRIEGSAPVTPATAPITDYASVTPTYFDTMRIPLLAGRPFRDSDTPQSPLVVIINETLARTHFGADNAVGRRLQIGLDDPPEWREIVGVVKDVKNAGADQPVRSQIYVPYFYSPNLVGTKAATFSVILRTNGDPLLLAGAVRRAIQSVDARQPIWQLQTMETTLDESLGRERFTLFLMGIFALTAFLLAIIGLSGVLAYTVTQRTREIGIRLAIGASPAAVLWMILRHSLLLVITGIIGGAVGSLIVTSSLETLLFQTSATDPLTLLAISGIFLLTAAVSGLVPALRAARIDPAITLRAD